MRALPVKVAASIVATTLLQLTSARAHDRAATETNGAQGQTLETDRGRFYLQMRMGGGFSWSRIQTASDDLSLSGWGPSVTLLPGVGLSRRFALVAELHWQATPDGEIAVSGLELGRGSAWQVSASPSLVVLTGRGWFLQPSIGYTRAWLTLKGQPDFEADQHGVSLGLTLGRDAPISTPWAAGAALQLRYLHFPEHENVTEDFLSVALEVALSKY